MTETLLFLYLSLTIVVLLTIRAFMSRNFGFYYFLVWNMFLAAVPVLLMSIFRSLPAAINGFRLLEFLILSGVWLLFLPNTFYLLTDLMHLNQSVLVNKRDHQHIPTVNYSRGDPWFTFDSFILFMVALYGMLAGGYAVREFYRFMSAHYPSLTLVVTGAVLVVCAFGIYIGRYGRWNSWDVITRPQKVIKDIVVTLGKRSEQRIILIVMATCLIFELTSWALVSVH